MFLNACFFVFVFLDPHISQEPGQHADGCTIETVGFLSPQVNDHPAAGRSTRRFLQVMMERREENVKCFPGSPVFP